MWLYLAVSGAFVLGVIVGDIIGRKQAYANFIQLQSYNENARRMAESYEAYVSNLKGEQNVQ